MIKIKTPSEIEEMKVAGALSKMALRRVGAAIKPGVLTSELDGIAESVIRMHRAIPTFKGYGGFPASICCSVNDEVVHGIPGMRMLEEGDIVSIDTGATINGWVGDNAWTFYCGTPSREAVELCEVTRDCLKAGIAKAVPGNHVGDIGAAVQELAERHGFGVLRDYVGHGVGHVMHEDPSVPNWGKRGRGPKLQAGMVIAIEPMITLGDYEVAVQGNGWTVSTVDHSIAAHYENTIAITKDGPVILTQDDDGPWCSMQGGIEERAPLCSVGVRMDGMCSFR
ncbi:MAG: type I methionyl aminopeptidase [Atopobiaceae bacterium]|nr:type I methionyl aminopeptidase [Atopobiaceae bacterium]